MVWHGIVQRHVRARIRFKISQANHTHIHTIRIQTPFEGGKMKDYFKDALLVYAKFSCTVVVSVLQGSA